MTRRACPVLLSFLSLGFTFLLAPGALRAAIQEDNARVRSWLREVDLLITPREREVFEGLKTPADREAFIQRFWQVRDPYPETPRNEARERWEERLAEARTRWSDLQDDRSRVFLVNGAPSETFDTHCAGQNLQVWTYQPQFQSRFRMTLVFHLADRAPARLWRAGDTPDLNSRDLVDCAADSSFAEAATWIRRVGKETYAVVLQRALASPRPREWVSSFRPAAPEGRARARSLPARLDVDFPGRQGEGIVRIQVAPGELSEQVSRMLGDSREVFVSGRILRGNEMVDSFRYRFEAPATAAAAGARPLTFERRLGPGRYRLEVQLDAPAADSSFVGERELAVPSVPAAAVSTVPATAPAPPASPAPQPSPEVQSPFAEADAALAAPRPGVRILGFEGKLIAGVQRVEARVDRAAGLPDAEQIDRVAFSLDGRLLLTRNRAPYVAEIDLGRTPRSHRLSVEGMNGRGEVLARDQLELNAGGQRFAARLVEPQPGRQYRRSLRARVEVEAPADQALDRVELYLGEKRVATLYQPPFSQPLTLPDSGGVGYVRAVAYLADGTATEDTVLLNSPSTPERMDIRLVELYTHVVDRAGRAVEGLGAGEVHVFEDGVRQSVRLVERVEDAPLRLVTLIDNSASMRPRLEPARQAALQFLRRTLRPRDQAAVITFNRSPHVAVGLTGDLQALEDGLSGLMADEETSLYDSLIFSLGYLGGTPGQRAVLLLSDGEDHTSTFGFAETLESARRAGIAVYAIGIDLPKGGPTEQLARLAAETGGRSFFLRGTGDLDRAYQEIERDLRSRYRISYQSSNTKASDAFRAVRVELARPGVEARTISGYYP